MSSKIKEKDKDKYIGWIPSISGNLIYELVNSESFTDSNSNRSVGDFLTIYSSGYLGGADTQKRQEQVVSTGLFDLNDQSPCPLNKDTVYTRFVCLLSKDVDDRSLKGSVWILPIIDVNKDSISGMLHSYHVGIIDSIEKYCKETRAKRSASFTDRQQTRKINYVCDYSSIKQAIEIDQTEFMCMRFDVTISPRGITEIWPAYCEGESKSTILNINSDDLSKLSLAEEVFIYLKHLLHEHKHHGEKDDNFLTAIKYKDEHSWLRLYRNLLRSITFQRRAISDSENVHALVSNISGACDYASSLLVVLGIESRIGSSQNSSLVEQEQKLLSNMKASTEVFLTKEEGFKADTYIETIKQTFKIYILLISIAISTMFYFAKGQELTGNSSFKDLVGALNNGFPLVPELISGNLLTVFVAVFLFVELILLVLYRRNKLITFLLVYKPIHFLNSGNKCNRS